jgi:low temperature requirement protein LtrA
MSNSPISRWRAPQLRVTVENEGINHASWIELFFDLVFVIVIAELNHYLSEHLSLSGFVQFVALSYFLCAEYNTMAGIALFCWHDAL